MPDKKLTDKEIPNVKELLEYKAKAHCELCDLKHLDCCNTCIYTAIKQFIELFNRLQAENEELKETVKVLRIGVEQAHLIRKDGKSPFNLLKAEIKAEAYKEFAELVKERMRHEYYHEYEIDRLLKELVGEDNGN